MQMSLCIVIHGSELIMQNETLYYADDNNNDVEFILSNVCPMWDKEPLCVPCEEVRGI